MAGHQRGALTGVRVIDLTTVLMGPLATRILGDHGADVIRVEAPATEAAVTGDDDSGVAAITLSIHRNKRTIVLDVKSEAGRAAMADLVGSADVFVSNMRSAALARLGLDAATLRAAHPALIHCVANGFGSTGPHAHRAAYDDAIQAMSGLAALPARISGDPAYVPAVIVDKTCSLIIVQAVMAALLHRHATGQGQTIEVPMFESMVSLNLIEHFRGAALIPPKGQIGYPRLLNPNRKPYRAADGWVAILPYTTANWRDFFALIGRHGLIGDPRYATHGARILNAEVLYGLLVEVAPTRTVAEWLSECERLSIPAAPVLDLVEVIDDDHIRAVDLIPVVEHPTEGPYRHVRDPVSYDTMSTELRHHAAAPGTHTAEVLGELGWTDEAIAALSM